MASLTQRTDTFLSYGSEFPEFEHLLQDSVAARNVEGLACVQRLYADDYDGMTFKWEIKTPAGAALVCWGEAGLDALAEAAIGHSSFKNVNICLRVLASTAAGQSSVLMSLSSLNSTLMQAITTSLTAQVARYARKKLTEFVINLSEDDVHLRVSNALQMLSVFPPIGDGSPVTELSRALALRTMVVGEPILREFEALIENAPDHEPSFQKFLTAHPQLIDPMAFQVWPKPDLHGAKEPDFLVRRSDDSYLVVEIESPAKPLVTEAGQMTAFVTQAEKQATDYRSFLVRRFEDAARFFPHFNEPDCLVVIGLEGPLTEAQRAALRDVNNHRHRLRIVGFDWILKRSRAVLTNLVQTSIEVSKVRMI